MWIWWLLSILPFILIGSVIMGIYLVSLIDQSESSPMQTTASLECYHCGQSTPATKKTCRHCGGELQ